jgi:hypothetical protein
MQQQDLFNSRIHATAGAMNAAGIQQKQPCKQQQLCSNRINAATGSIQQQDPFNSRIHATAGSMQQQEL